MANTRARQPVDGVTLTFNRGNSAGKDQSALTLRTRDIAARRPRFGYDNSDKLQTANGPALSPDRCLMTILFTAAPFTSAALNMLTIPIA